MNIINMSILIFLIGFLAVGSQLYQSDMEYGIERDIYNFTETKIIIHKINISELHPIEQTKGLINIGRVYKMLDAGVNFALVTIGETLKMGVEYGYQNPNINWKKIFKLVTLVLVVWVAVMLIKPIGYLFVFLFMIIMWIVEKSKKRKRRKTNEQSK